MRNNVAGVVILYVLVLAACAPKGETARGAPPQPKEIIDLGALVTADLPERVWGKALLAEMKFDRPNSFDVLRWEWKTEAGSFRGSNAYYTLFNHGGPHVDAPNHMGLGGGIDSLAMESFAGPLKVFDVRRFPKGRSVPVDVFRDAVAPGDIVLIYTGYTPPPTDDAYPETITLSPEAAEYLASLPVRAFGTDAFSVANLQDKTPVESETVVARAVPIHHAFLSRGIPIYEQLSNVDKLIDKKNMYFVGAPLNIRDGDGMIVRPAVLVY